MLQSYPDAKDATSIVSAMTSEKVVSCNRMTTGDQHFVFDVTTDKSHYVLRMTDQKQRKKFISALYWQDKLLPLGIPLAQFIQIDMENKYSQFPSLLMHRLQGTDLINVYANLTDEDKQQLAQEIVIIQAKTLTLPQGACYGITDSYESITADKSWYDFLANRLILFKELITSTQIFDPLKINSVIELANDLKSELSAVPATPFLWDASERNVIVSGGKITGIVDVDEICFGDPLLVLGLTYTALEAEGFDALYVDYWRGTLNLNEERTRLLNFYRLFYVVVFMRKQAMMSANNKKVHFNTQRLNHLFNECYQRCKHG